MCSPLHISVQHWLPVLVAGSFSQLRPTLVLLRSLSCHCTWQDNMEVCDIIITTQLETYCSNCSMFSIIVAISLAVGRRARGKVGIFDCSWISSFKSLTAHYRQVPHMQKVIMSMRITFISDVSRVTCFVLLEISAATESWVNILSHTPGIKVFHA